MRPEGIRKALLELEGRPGILHLNDGSRLRVRSREHRMVGPEYLYVVVGNDVRHVAFRNITSVEGRGRRASRSRPA
jgi:hypothetical protein